VIYRAGTEAVVEELENSLEFEGFIKGTEVFNRKMRERKVERCRELKRMAVCSECPVYDECDLLKQHLRDLR
jgi:hypothetical protein